jgi:adenylate kinase
LKSSVQRYCSGSKSRTRESRQCEWACWDSGLPAAQRQAEFFPEGYDLEAAIYLDMPDPQVRHRVRSRRLCDRCGIDYALIESRPRREDICEFCAGRLVTREDDTPEALTRRLRDHHQTADPVLELLRDRVRVFVVDASRDPDMVQHEIYTRLGLLSPHTPGDGSADPIEAAG